MPSSPLRALIAIYLVAGLTLGIGSLSARAQANLRILGSVRDAVSTTMVK